MALARLNITAPQPSPYKFALFCRLACEGRSVVVRSAFGALVALLRFSDPLPAGVPLCFGIAILETVKPNLLTR
ncbi:hypothetical protein ASE23_06650 [Rhizobium sp. Root73]|nr:hypothetical protein ASD36_08885 [Rhizobium sp. Root1334]KRC04800.1 hypothetical protein ASE23_06650 [Rhizobium sp. Root73]